MDRPLQDRVILAPSTASARPSVQDEARSVLWWVLVSLGAGAIAGFVVGGIGGRLAMLLLRLTSPDVVIGITSDDGFEIGVVSLQTLNLVFAMTMVGGVTGVFYGALRSAIPGRLRLPLWVTVWACFGGASIVHDDGVDFTLVEPALLSIVLFVALPGIGAGVVVLLVERWQRAAPWRDRRLTALLVVASLASTFALIFAALVAAAALLLRRLPELPRAGWAVLRVAVPALLGLAAIVAGVDLLQESSRILD
jgi:hypothetical protein